MAVRDVIQIDEEKCDGCGQCIPACAERALQIVGGKAKLVSDVYCDGLGACIGECPRGALNVTKREAADFDADAVRLRLDYEDEGVPADRATGSNDKAQGRCELEGLAGERGEATQVPSMLDNWPVQIKLLPTKAPYFEGADLVITGDCVPFAFADFHRSFLGGKVLMIGCPKLDDAQFYRRKLAEIFTRNEINSVSVLYMEVPCCFGLVHLVHESMKESGKDIPLSITKIGIKGNIIETALVPRGGGS